LNDAAPRVVAEHLPGVSVQPSETGMIAYDCPPNVGTLYRVKGVDQSVSLSLVHATDRLDPAHDRYAEDEGYQVVGEDTAADDALIWTYTHTGNGRARRGEVRRRRDDHRGERVRAGTDGGRPRGVDRVGK
jgi:hypothetical protein